MFVLNIRWYYIGMAHNVIFKKLSNGIKLVLVPQASSLATTIAVLVEAGSSYEDKNIAGISHFLEHMCFKGTVNRPEAIIISRELNGIGAEYNAFTNREYTGYYAKVKNELFDKALDVVADVYLHPLIDEKEIEKEKGVIIEEINMYEDVPQRKVSNVFMELLYGTQPAGRPIAGTKEVVRSITREKFLSYRGKHYVPQATTVIVAGGAPMKAIEKKIETIFGSMKKGKKEGKIATKDVQSKPKEQILFKESDQTHFILGFRAFNMYDKRRFALALLTDILGGSMGSRLWQSVREELGAAYYIYAVPDLSTDHGYVAMAAGVNNEKLNEVISVSLKEFSKLKTERISKDELERAKEHLIGSFILSLETSDDLGIYYGMQALMKEKIMGPEEFEKKIRAVRAEDIQNLAKELFVSKTLNLALIGPHKGKSFLPLLKV